MLNPIEAYADCGKKAAIARNEHDEARAQFAANHFRRMRGLEKPEDRIAVTKAYDDAYKAARNVPKVL